MPLATPRFSFMVRVEQSEIPAAPGVIGIRSSVIPAGLIHKPAELAHLLLRIPPNSMPPQHLAPWGNPRRELAHLLTYPQRLAAALAYALRPPLPSCPNAIAPNLVVANVGR